MKVLPTAPSLGQVTGFARCRNIQQGPVFIIASGGSAKDFPIEAFANTPMITMNGAISMFLGTGIQPFFYACSDTSFSLQQPELFAQAMAISQRVVLWEEHARTIPTQPQGELYLLKKAPRQTWKERLLRSNSDLVRPPLHWCNRGRNIGFSKNLEQGFFDARTVAYLALQLAYHAGFDTAILVGVDLVSSVDRFYETPDTFKSPCGLDQHLESRILPSLKLMSDKVMNKDFAVYNLSPTSRIPTSIIPGIRLDELGRLVDR
ncbi:lipopolysaccharide biosynthesis protein [Pseudomonas sp. NPDC089530]|uniref:lipopolysaccharide biosynthesis protein n=1 Tax=Pseudomonas sp. NPDC089530 TaxID=3390651 RepID=UPI003D087D23